MVSITTKERTSSKGVISYQVQVRGKGVAKPYSKSFPTQEKRKNGLLLMRRSVMVTLRKI